MLRGILIGDNAKAEYHPLENIREELCSAFKDMEITHTDEYAEILSRGLEGYDFCVCYSDRWQDQISPEEVAGILKFVSNGGGMLVIHSGISFQKRYEYAQMVGGKFTEHPPYCELTFRTTDTEHFITKGISDFTINEEPYRFDFDNFTEKEVLLQYDYEGVTYPAAWCHEFAKGRIVYLAPGHDVDAFKNQTYKELILRSAQWINSNK